MPATKMLYRLRAPFFDGKVLHPRGAELVFSPADAPKSALCLGKSAAAKKAKPKEAPEPETLSEATDVMPDLFEAKPGAALADLTPKRKKG